MIVQRMIVQRMIAHWMIVQRIRDLLQYWLVLTNSNRFTWSGDQSWKLS